MENNLEKLAEKLKKSKQRIIAVFLSATILVSGIASCNFMKKNNKDNSKDKNAHDYESSILSMVEEELSKEDSLIEEEGLNEVERPTIKPEVTPHKIMPSEPKINNENNFEEINLSTIPEEKEEHICKYNEYEVLNDKYHKEICECGKFRTVEHSYNVLYTNYIYNYENTYTQVITKECSVCKHRIKEEKLLTDLEFTEWVYNKDTGKDERECLDYDIVEEREHKHEFTIFEDFDEKVHKEYCVCGEVQLVDHKLNVKNKEYIKNNDETYKEIITLECSDCKHQIIVENLLKDLEFTEWIYNKDTGKDERKCIGYDIVEVREHLHKPSSIINFDKEYEYSYCNDCQELIKTPHNLVSVVNPDYSITYKCENDGCNYSYKIDHIHNFGDIKDMIVIMNIDIVKNVMKN